LLKLYFGNEISGSPRNVSRNSRLTMRPGVWPVLLIPDYRPCARNYERDVRMAGAPLAVI